MDVSQVTVSWSSVTVDPQRAWYIQNQVNDHNATVYADILHDINQQEQGVFTCTIRVTNNFITDYVITKNNVRPDPTAIRSHLKQASH